MKSLSAAKTGIPSVQKDTRTLSLNVLASTSFRKSYDFYGPADLTANDVGSYRDFLQTVLDNIILLMLALRRFLTGCFVPKGWTRIGAAAAIFKMPEKGLSANKIYGNLFVINFAGHSTTVNTLAFAMLLLAAHPKVQDWISEEIMTLTSDIQAEEWDHNELFPQLKRLYSSIMLLPKWTLLRAQTLKVGDRTLNIPPAHPKYWPDPNIWKPSRWIIRPSPTDQIHNKELLEPKQNTYFLWSSGSQNCPGKKFSEVGAVAVLACLLKSHRLDVKREAEESKTAV
ncbi:cytochrome P450 [Camillea tinctor]|nr:cytochrome P450 [Camillea tinctor]